MAEQDTEIDYDSIISQLKFFYPGELFTFESVESDIITGKILHTPSDFLPYLQTALLDEKFIEVRFDGNELPHFTKIIDWHRKDVSEDSEDLPHDQQADQPAAYFQDMTHITSLPLEPGIGNYHIRNSKKVIMRFFTKAFAVEMCTTFLSIDKDIDIPVLHFHFPDIFRLLYGVREYRAKVIKGFDLRVIIAGKRKQTDIVAQALNISVSGMAFSLQKKESTQFFADEVRKLKVLYNDEEILNLNAKVRHVTRIRKRTSIAFMCGVEFDIVTRGLAAEIESLVAMVQRAHLQSLSGMARETGYNLIT